MTNLSLYVVTFIQATIANFNREERGQDLLEYVLLGGLIAAAIVALVAIFNPFLADMATNIGQCLDFDSATDCNPGF